MGTHKHFVATPAVVLALLVELASEAVIRGPTDDALLVEGGDDAVRLLLDEGDAVHVVREVNEGPLQLLAAVLLLPKGGVDVARNLQLLWGCCCCCRRRRHCCRKKQHASNTRLDARLQNRPNLFLPEDEVVELLLQHLVGVVDQELLVEVLREHLETEDVQQPDKPAARTRR